jgi:XRE family transcriptional regulator, regulator of sulfur utilization
MQNVKDRIFLRKIGERIRSLRKERGLSQMELGVMMGNHGEQVGRIERGEVNVTVCTLKIISESLSVKLAELVTVE